MPILNNDDPRTYFADAGGVAPRCPKCAEPMTAESVSHEPAEPFYDRRPLGEHGSQLPRLVDETPERLTVEFVCRRGHHKRVL